MSFIWFVIAAGLEIAGCYSVWAWLRLGRSPWWIVPGTVSLLLFAYSLTRVDSLFAGRAFAAYGGVYIVASLVWLRLVEGGKPSLTDLIGSLTCIAGATIILAGTSRIP